MLETVEIAPVGPERLSTVLAAPMLEAFDAAAEQARGVLDGRVIWNVNSTARGGGVAELLRPHVGYARERRAAR